MLRLRLFIWGSIIALGVADTLLMLIRDYTLRLDIKYSLSAFTACSLLLISLLFRRFNPREIVADGTEALAQFILLAPAAVLFIYVGTPTSQVFYDRLFLAADYAIGIDWLTWLYWINEQPMLSNVLNHAYVTFSVQIFTTIIALAIVRRFYEMYRFIAMISLSLISLAIISFLLPSMGPCHFHQLHPEDFENLRILPGCVHIEHVKELYAGSMRIFQPVHFQGILTFPSFHACAAVLFIHSNWCMKWLRWPLLIINVLMIVATPFVGGHYVVDVIAGIAIAAVTILIARKIFPAPSTGTTFSNMDNAAPK